MKKFKLTAALLVAATLALGGCNFLSGGGGGKKRRSSSTEPTQTTTVDPTSDPTSAPTSDPTSSPTSDPTSSVDPTSSSDPTSTPTSSSDPTSSEPPAPTEWDSEVQSLMMEEIGLILPFFEGSWTWNQSQQRNNAVQGYISGDITSTINAAFVASSDWEDGGVDSYGDPLYIHTNADESTVTANVWYSTQDTCSVIDAWWAEKQERTTDTAWNDSVKEVMMEVLGEELPFFQLGKNYQIYDSSAFAFRLVDFYTKEDLGSAYAEVLTSNGYTFLRNDDAGDPVYGKDALEEGAKIELNVWFDTTGGNVIDATFIPNKTVTDTWPAEAFADITAATGYTVPSYEASSYSWYAKDGVVYVESATTSNLCDAYASALAELNLLVGVSDEYGEAYDWEETIDVYFEATGEYDDDYNLVVDGFVIAVQATEPASEFVSEWPATAINTYLAGFELDGSVVPSSDNPSGKGIKVYEMSLEAAEAYLLSVYAMYIQYGLMTEEEVLAMAPAYAGLYVEVYDDSLAHDLLTAYVAKFDDTWTIEEDSESGITYATRGEVQLSLEATNYSLKVQIVEPQSEPPVVEKSVTYTFSNTNNSKEVTDTSTIYGWFHSDGDSVISGVSSPSAVYAGANGGSGDSAWTLGNSLKIGKSTAGGTLTFTLAEGVSVNKIVITGYGWKNSSSKPLVITCGGVASANDPLTYTNKTNVEGGLANSVEFEFETPLTGSFTISTGDTAVLITALQIIYEE